MYTQNFFKLVLIMCLKITYVVNTKNKGQFNLFETKNPKEATDIFINHGMFLQQHYPSKIDAMTRKPSVNVVPHVCDNIDKDGKSNRIYGDAVCFHACKELHGDASIMVKRAKCMQTNANIRSSNDQTVIKKEVLLAQCVCENNKIEKTFNITNGPARNYYYILEVDAQSKINVVASIHLNVKTNVIPKMKIQETYDPLEADEIFGLYGVRKSTSGLMKRVANLVSNRITKYLDAPTQESYCRKIMQLPHYVKKGLKNLRTPVECFEGVVERQYQMKDKNKTFVSGFQVIECKHETGSFFVLDGPKENFYYLAESQFLNIGRKPGFDIPRVFNISAVVNFS